MMTKILITGLSGLLGANIGYLLRDKYGVYGQYNLAPVNIEGIEAFKCDFHKDDISAHIDNIHPDIIVHCAALTNIDRCEDDPENTFFINAKITGDIARIASRVGIKMIYISTDSVYADTEGVSYKEEDSLGPLNVYSGSKRRGEELALQAGGDLVILRTTIYGYNYQEKTSLSEWVVSNLEDNKAINMFTDVYFNPILVNDLTRVIEFFLNEGHTGIYNADSRGVISKYDFGVKLAEKFGKDKDLIKPVSVEEHGFRARRPKNMATDTRKIESLMKMPSVDEGIERYYQLYLEGYHHKIKEGR